ncbi:cell wall-binding repeat-containing protein [Catenulispora pinisilvae]|uniref:cell wall-binding repeat-containing protein n=1 Tax=Catenulispora pinisilvae TaxID=2705253 RepID=UPI001890E6B9|nr:cell wall-binding repeat-containing protein [Catenulispora pinisilvae]
MKRIRLTASAIAASSLGSLGLVGIGATSAHAASTTPNTAFSGKGFDTCIAPNSAMMDDWYAHSPYRGVGVYIGGASYHPDQDCASTANPKPPTDGGYTKDWVAHQAATGWGMWAIYAGQQGPTLTAAGADPTALGTTDAADAVQKATNLGFAPGTTIFVDMEPYHEDATAKAVVAYLKSFGNALNGTGFKLGLYGTSGNPASGHSALSDATADPALTAQISAVDISGTTSDQANFNATTNDPYVPATDWAKHQRVHQYFLDVNRQYGSSPAIQVDEDDVDLSPTSHVTLDPSQVHAVRWAGNDRIGTAVAVSQKLWPTTTDNQADFYAPADKRPLAKSAVLSRSDQFADALGGSALAAHDSGPLLLTETKALNPATANELRRTLAPGSPVYLLGGNQALSPAVATAVQKLGFNPVRVAGPDRFSTSVAIAQQMAGDMKDSGGHPAVQRVLLATAKDFPDALAAGTAAGATPDTVLVLTNGTQMPPATSTFLHQRAGTPAGANVYPVGGAANTAAKTLGAATVPAGNLKLDGLVGATRYETAALVAHQFFGATGTPHMYGVATGVQWADALSGGAAMATLDGPLLLTEPTSLAPATRGFLNAEEAGGSIEVGVVLGGTAAISNGVFNSL